MKLYIAGKVSKDSSFGKHHWRDEFCAKLSELSGLELTHNDPLSIDEDPENYEAIFAKDVSLIKESDCFVVYLSDDISVGGSQEILIAKYFKKPVIGFAPVGGKFNGASREMQGKHIDYYKDPFVFSTCDVVCGTVEEVAKNLKNIQKIEIEDITLIDRLMEKHKNY